jgi:serine/threonine protein kinase
MQQDSRVFSDEFDKLIGSYYSPCKPELEGFSDASTHFHAKSGADQEDIIPQQVGRFTTIDKIGRGGLGLVLRAWDARLDREVAVKVLRRCHHDNPEMVTQFLREAKITAKLEHPGVIPIYDKGTTDDGLPFFAMRILSGATLSKRLSKRPDSNPTQLADRNILRVFEKTCETVAYAHTQQIVHHDLKPDNIMTNAFGVVKVIDWGFATTPEIRSSSMQRVFGTPAYMAREQARGQGDTDARSDIFSLGAILCEILTGAPPYRGETQHEIYLKARIGSLGDTHQRLDKLTAYPMLVDLTRRCLDPEPDKRPSDATTLALTAGTARR